MKLTVNTEIKQTSALIKLEGYINGTSPIETPNLGFAETIDIDFENVKYINSVGVGQWVRWIAESEAKYPKKLFQYWNCPNIIVDQINIVKGFVPKKCLIKSLFVPYYSEEKDQRKMVLLLREKHYCEKTEKKEHYVHLPKVHNEVDREELEPDINVDKYFHFLK